jgi:peptidoglycan/xylan/chitin deacetylase (PgdA/CDA1 family)
MKFHASSIAAFALLFLGSEVCLAAKSCKSYYETTADDDCDAIAVKNNETVAKLTHDNPGIVCDFLVEGDLLCIGYGSGDGTLPRIPLPDRKCTVKGTFALTFDDGPYNYTYGLLKFLKRKGLKATFFVNGDNIGKIFNFNSTIKKMYKDGHQIASHTWSHKDITTLSETDFLSELKKIDDAIKAIIGVRPKFFRPPYGNTNLKTLKLLKSLGYRVIKWDVGNDDATGVQPKTLKQDQLAFIASLKNVGIHPKKPGHISLEHDVLKVTAQKFAPWVYPYVKKLGYKPVTVGACLGVPKKSDWYRK